jgi:hypothetical protein
VNGDARCLLHADPGLRGRAPQVGRLVVVQTQIHGHRHGWYRSGTIRGRRAPGAGRRARRYAALTAVTSFVSESFASPNSITVFGS